MCSYKQTVHRVWILKQKNYICTMQVKIINRKTKSERVLPQELAENIVRRSRFWYIAGPVAEKAKPAPKATPKPVEVPEQSAEAEPPEKTE
jgi:hypothetical protein